MASRMFVRLCHVYDQSMKSSDVSHTPKPTIFLGGPWTRASVSSLQYLNVFFGEKKGEKKRKNREKHFSSEFENIDETYESLSLTGPKQDLLRICLIVVKCPLVIRNRSDFLSPVGSPQQKLGRNRLTVNLHEGN